MCLLLKYLTVRIGIIIKQRGIVEVNNSINHRWNHKSLPRQNKCFLERGEEKRKKKKEVKEWFKMWRDDSPKPFENINTYL